MKEKAVHKAPKEAIVTQNLDNFVQPWNYIAAFCAEIKLR